MLNNKIIIFDCKSGNGLYLQKFLLELNFEVEISNKTSLIRKSDFLFIPGNSNTLRLKEELSKIKDFHKIIKDKKIIAICSGMQIFYKEIQEDNNKQNSYGLLDRKLKSFYKKNYHIGWNKIISKNKILTQFRKSYFYFSHGFSNFDIKTKSCIAYSNFQSQNFCSIFKKNNILGLQFHPEKSGEDGKKFMIEILTNYDKL